MRALVTGGAGFVGSHLVEALLARGDEVAVFDKTEPISRYADIPNYAGVPYWTGDLLDGVPRAALEGQDIVYHFAANASVRGGTDHPSRDMEQNLIGTMNLLEAMRQTNVKRIMFASSAAVYGDTTVIPTPEDCPMPVQNSLYGASKLAAEGLISAYCHGFGFEATIFRFVPLLGERYHRGHVRDFYDKLKADPLRIEILGIREQRNSYVYVKDAVAAVVAVVDKDHVRPPVEVFNVGNDETASVEDSLNWICDELDIYAKRHYTGQSWAGDNPRILSWARAKHRLGWAPTVSIRDAVIRTVRSFDA
jgi:UDP-glucose 4-epimerase